MSDSPARAAAVRLLAGLEAGGATAAELRQAAEQLDPVLLYAVVRFVRDIYSVSNPASSAVLERLTRLTAAYPALVASFKQGEADAVARWFRSAHTFREFRGRGSELIATLAAKLEH